MCVSGSPHSPLLRYGYVFANLHSLSYTYHRLMVLKKGKRKKKTIGLPPGLNPYGGSIAVGTRDRVTPEVCRRPAGAEALCAT